MSMRAMNLAVYAALAALSILVIRAVSSIPVTMPGDVGSGFLPSILAWTILALCAFGALRTVLAGAQGPFRANHLSRLAVTSGVVALFLLSWQRFGLFYPQSFVFLFVLFTWYRPGLLAPRHIALNAVVAAGITLVCYVTFTFLVYVDL